MKIEIFTPNRISIIIGTFAALLLVLLEVFLAWLGLYKWSYSIVFVSASVGFIFVYIISYLLLNKLLINKIFPLYKIISEPKNEQSFKKSLNILKKANVDVANWVVQKNQEIDRLKKNEKFRREFLSNVSHELKTPLFSIQGYITTLLEGGLEDESINRKFLEKADKNINRMISIIQDLETISKIENNEIELHYENFEITSLIKEIFEMLETKAAKRGIKLFLINPSKPYFVHADRQRIADVLYNLVLNSINYGKDNGHTTIYIHDLNEKILVEVSDNGIGIEEKYLERIFERFFRIDKSRSRDSGGTGLGLSIVKHILESHQQNIYVKSTYGVGSSFSFTLNKA